MKTICEQRIEKARARIMLKSGFYGSLVVRLEPVCVPACDTAATDGKHIFYAPEFIESLSDEKLQGLLVHEVMHCANGHQWRRGERDHETFNLACDYAINPDVLAAGYELPDGGCIDAQYIGLSAEEIYRRLCQQQAESKAEQKEQAEQQGAQSEEDEEDEGEGGDEQETGESGAQDGEDGEDGESGESGEDGEDGESGESGEDGEDGEEEGGDEQGAGGGGGDGQEDSDGDAQDGESGESLEGEGKGEGEAKGAPTPTHTSDPGGCGAIIDSPVPMTEEEKEKLKHEWQEAVIQATKFDNGKGDIPGNIKTMVNEILHPQESWEELLRTYFDSFAQDDYSFARPNRSGIPHDIFLPSPDGEGCGEMVVAVDTSGSINEEMFRRFIGVMNDITETITPSVIHVVQFDTGVTHVDELYDGEPIGADIYGRGGTDLTAPFTWLEDQTSLHPDVLVVFTDMGDNLENLNGHEPACPTLWVDWHGGYYDEETNRGYGGGGLPFGDYVKVEMED